MYRIIALERRAHTSWPTPCNAPYGQGFPIFTTNYQMIWDARTRRGHPEIAEYHSPYGAYGEDAFSKDSIAHVETRFTLRKTSLGSHKQDQVTASGNHPGENLRQD